MDILLAKVTQQAMNYAIRSGIAITSGYALQQCSRLMKTQDRKEREELGSLQRRLEGKIRIISPAIDMIELIAARGNTSLESAVSLTKAIRWDIQNLGVKIAKAAADAESSRREKPTAVSKAQKEVELKVIVTEMKLLLERIEDAVPLINLAITTSGVSLSTNLPATISPSRLLQASTFLSAGDAQYARNTTSLYTQIGPTFTLSMYMLFSGHARPLRDDDEFRSTTWKEVVHKTQVKLIRAPLNRIYDFPQSPSDSNGSFTAAQQSNGRDVPCSSRIPSRGRSDEFAYQLSIIEDLDDNRVHSFEEDEAQPGPLNDVALAGIREVLPIHEVSKIFYADTGKILNIGSEGETNNPVLLFKRDINAAPPRRMMETYDNDVSLYDNDNDDAYDYDLKDSDEDYENDEDSDDDTQGGGDVKASNDADNDASYLEAQFARESTARTELQDKEPLKSVSWRLPADLDPEWIAFEVYAEESDSESGYESETEDLDHTSKTHSTQRQASLEPELSVALENLRLGSSPTSQDELVGASNTASMSFAAAGPIRTSLSLLEMLIRLTSLQQFQQSSHLAITDELLNFFLEESSTTGAGHGDTDARKRIRLEARQRVGFDPYDESPIKRRGEVYQSRPDEGYDNEYSDGVSDAASVLPTRELASAPSTPLRFRHGPARSRSGTPSSSSSLRKSPSVTTPPGTLKSRQTFLREEKTALRKGSPLARSASPSEGLADRPLAGERV